MDSLEAYSYQFTNHQKGIKCIGEKYPPTEGDQVTISMLETLLNISPIVKITHIIQLRGGR
jgi:hypothetical protein